MEIAVSARKHGITDHDIRHAVDHYVYVAFVASDVPPVHILYLGPDRAGNLLEVVTIERDDGGELAIHAMKMRSRHRSLLRDRDDR